MQAQASLQLDPSKRVSVAYTPDETFKGISNVDLTGNLQVSPAIMTLTGLLSTSKPRPATQKAAHAP